MEVKNIKLSNYVGQVKEKDEVSVNDHMVNVDKDLQNLRIETNKIIRYVKGQSWNDINIGSIGLGTGASAPDNVAISSTSILVKAFDGNVTTEQLYGAVELLHGYKEGTDISPHIHWLPTTNGTGNVRWQLEYVISDHDNPALVSSTTITVDSSATGIAWKETVSEFPDISGTNLKIGNQFAFRLFRVPTAPDDYPSDAAVLTVGIHYQQNTLGSATEFDK